ncbi:thioesterase II family protein [Streptomyces sp. URMC 129]|uniref:thioesterase II family protein n=1 Tax=Streptomyces sp. URMC 129 TaxID=3423407 RepID=UPI003F1C7CED
MARATGSSRWLRCHRPRPDAGVRLLCFPPAGAGATAYAAWPRYLPEDVEVHAVQAPGREDRADEAPLTSVEQLIDALLPELAKLAEGPFVLYGHSMGALLAFEAARRAEAAWPHGPVLLAVSGLPAPDRLGRSSLHRQPDNRLLAHLAWLDGTGTALDERIARSVLPALRADIAVCENHSHTGGPPLRCPISAFVGAGDPSVDAAGMARWGHHTARGFGTRVLPGSHSFVETSRESMLEALVQDIAACLD